MISSRSIKLMLCLFLLSIALIACSSGDSDNKTDTDSAEGNNEIGEDIKFAMATAPPHLDSHASPSQQTADVARHVFETLVTVDSEFNVQPMLAESWEQSEDGTTLTFNLREGILFHNGEELKAEDVIASLERWIRLSSLGKADFEGATMEAPDDYTVVIKQPAPVSTALTTLAYGGGNFASIMPKEVVDNASDASVDEYIGTGPFKFEEWRQDQYIYLTKFDDYKPLDTPADGLSGKKEALVEGIQFIFVPDASTRIAGIRTGEYDAIREVQLDMAPQLADDPEITTFIDPFGQLNIFYNKSEGLFTDVRAREAVATAINKEAMLLAAVSNEEYYTLDHSLMMNYQSALWSSDAGKDDYFADRDLDKAKQLINETDYDGEEITIIASRESIVLYNAAVVLKENLDEIGLNTALEIYDWPTYLDKRDDPAAFDLLVGASTPKLDPTSMAYLRSDFVGWTVSEELDEIIENFKSAPSIDDAKIIYNDLQAWFYEYIPVTKVGDYANVNATRNNLSGYDYLDGPIFWNVTNDK